jgi:hypothetical protein
MMFERAMPDELKKPGVEEEDDDDGSNSSNRPLIALAFLVVLAIGGWLLISKLMDANKLQDCVMSGRKNCAPIDESTLKR